MSKRIMKEELIEIINEHIGLWLSDEGEFPFYYRLDRDHILCIEEDDWDKTELQIFLKEETGDDRWPEDTIYTESITKDYNEDGNGNELVEAIVASILQSLGYPSYTDEDFLYVLQETTLLCYNLCAGDMPVEAQMGLFEAIQDLAREFCESEDMSEPSEQRRNKLASFINKMLG